MDILLEVHGKRLTALEKWRWFISGGLAVIAFGLTTFGFILIDRMIRLPVP